MTERIELAPGYSVCRVINGLWQLSQGHQSAPVDPAAAVATLLRMVESGFTTFDCADIYLGVEELLGLLLRELRPHSGPNAVQIHTKYVPDRSALAMLQRSDVSTSIEGSLTRLGVERLDLVQLHWWDYEKTNYLEVAGWLGDLRTEGKIRCLGTTNFDSAHLEELVAAGIPVVANQTQYSLLDRRPQGAMTALCGHTDTSLLCYGVLGGGFLSDKYLGAADPRPPFANRSLVKYKLIIDEFGGWELFQELLRTMKDIASRHATTIPAIAARWVLDRDQVAAVMIGTRSDAHADKNRGIFTIRLDGEDHDRIDQVLARAGSPNGDPFELERDPEGPHSKIMLTDLNSLRG